MGVPFALAEGDRQRLSRLFEEARDRGLLGPGPVDPQIEHALAFGEAVADAPAASSEAVDLGTGGGIPGLALALAWPASRWLLVDGRERATGFVDEAVARLGLSARVRVVTVRAEDLGRDPTHRGRHALVVARGFGPPAAVAECAAPLLEIGGRLVVSEPPGGEGLRWPEAPLARLGMRLVGVVQRPRATFAVFEQVEACPPTFPRRTGIPAKRPLFPPPTIPDVSRETGGGP